MSCLILAWRDLRFNAGMSSCIVLALCAVLTPLLIIFGLRTGVLAHLEANLTSSPVNLELKLTGNYQLKPDFIKALQQDPAVAFVVPLTRSLSVGCNLRAMHGRLSGVSAIPTAAGDPLLVGAHLPPATDDSAIYVSASVAQKAQLQVGDSVTLSVQRELEGKQQAARASFEVKGILSRALLPTDSILVTVPVILAMEDYRDGFEPAIFSDNSKPNTTRQYFAKVRLYARDIYAVEPLVERLEQAGISTHSKIAQISELKAINRALSAIVQVITAVTLVGGIGALWGLLSAALALKRESFAMLRLMGFTPGMVYLTAWLESLILGLCGVAISALLCKLGSLILQQLFAAILGGSQLSFLTLAQWGYFALGAFVVLTLLTLGAVKRQLLAQTPAAIMRRGE